jgi:hypothetical protein
MKEFSAFGLFVTFGAGLAILAIYLNKRRNDAWRAFAESMGLVGPAPGIFASPVITGTHLGLDVQFDLETIGGGKNRQVFTRCAIRIPLVLPQGMVVSRESFFSGIDRFFGMQDIQTGEPEFDGKVIIKGSDPLAIKGYFSHPTRREAAEKIVLFSTRSRIEQNQVLLVQRGVVVDSAQLAELLNSAVSTARNLA